VVAAGAVAVAAGVMDDNAAVGLAVCGFSSLAPLHAITRTAINPSTDRIPTCDIDYLSLK
jgi:hypothetical protein